MPTEAYLELQRSLPHAMIVDANPLLDELRAVKDERELALMRSVNDRAADAICASFVEGKDGVTTKAMESSVRLGNGGAWTPVPVVLHRGRPRISSGAFADTMDEGSCAAP